MKINCRDSHKYFTGNAERTEELGLELGASLQGGEVLALYGQIGSGKTTLTRGIARALSINEPLTSPTFTLINEYQGRFMLRHLDLYRLNSADEFYYIGGDELLYDRSITVIEWSEKIETLLPAETIHIYLSIVEGGRHIHINPQGEAADE